MALAGEGFLVLWSDVLPQAEAEWRAWHVREHMPDRMTVPGLEMGRRYLDASRPRHQTFMIYEARSLAVFRSEAYLAQLNAPSALTRGLLPSIRNILRGVCRTAASRGAGLGTVIAATRVVCGEGGNRVDPHVAVALIDAALDKRGVIAAHLGVADRELTGIPTTEQKLRHDADEAFDALLMIEGDDRSEVADVAEEIVAGPTFAALRPIGVSTGVYDLVYLLSAKTAG